MGHLLLKCVKNKVPKLSSTFAECATYTTSLATRGMDKTIQQSNCCLPSGMSAVLLYVVCFWLS